MEPNCIDLFTPKGLGKRKSNSGAAQRYKDTSLLLQWSGEPRFSPVSSYRADFICQSLPQTRIVNEMEPIHSRGNYGLKRRQIRQNTKATALRTAPLLAWNTPDEGTHAKPCVGTERDRMVSSRTLSRESKNIFSRESLSKNSVPKENHTSQSDNSHVIETVTKLDL